MFRNRSTETSASNSARTPTSYQQISETDENFENESERSRSDVVLEGSSSSRRPLQNFLLMSVLFSANHGCVVSCLALASARMGTIGAWQSGILMLSYAASALLGATYAVKTLGSRNAMTLGMLCYCAYVGCFFVATRILGDDTRASEQRAAIAYLGALVGGIGAGFLWTAQGTYFGLASQDYASQTGTTREDSTSKLAGYFAFLYLLEEVLLRLMSTVLLELGVATWGTIFGIYTLITIGSTMFMPCLVHDYPRTLSTETRASAPSETSTLSKDSILYKTTVAFQLLKDDPKMKYMIGLNAVFGFVSAFLNSYVNGQVVPVALDDPESKYVGILTSTISIVAAIMSLVFGRLASVWGKGRILIIGALAFGGVVLPFWVQPDAKAYGWYSLLVIYGLHGTGRATFEGTLRSTFADYFPSEKEGAFANIILQNGIASGVGYILTFALACNTPSRYCVQYLNGSLHDVLTFELIALASVVFAIVGYLQVSRIRQMEQQGNSLTEPSSESRIGDADNLLQLDENGVPA